MIDYFSNIPSQTVCAVILAISYDFPGIADTTLTKKKIIQELLIEKRQHSETQASAVGPVS